jgi:hypothetical protein
LSHQQSTAITSRLWLDFLHIHAQSRIESICKQGLVLCLLINRNNTYFRPKLLQQLNHYINKLVSCCIISMVDCCVASIELINHSIDRSNSIVFRWYFTHNIQCVVVNSKKSQMGIFSNIHYYFILFLLLDVVKKTFSG